MKTTLNDLIGNTDIYLIDQILKERYKPTDVILDAGCGKARNIHWFYKNNYNIHAIDIDSTTVRYSKINYPRIKDQIHHLAIEDIDELKMVFDHIICNAVLHFAESYDHFFEMFSSLFDVLKPHGTMFIRMTSDIGLEQLQDSIEGVYRIPDGTKRFLLTQNILEKLLIDFSIELLEPLKTVNVDGKRCMTTIVLQKK